MHAKDRDEIREMVHGMFAAHRRDFQHLQVMDCPACGHKTSWWKDVNKYLSLLPPSTKGYEIDTLENACDIFTCLTCGRSFRQEQGWVRKLIEVSAEPQK